MLYRSGYFVTAGHNKKATADLIHWHGFDDGVYDSLTQSLFCGCTKSKNKLWQI